MSKHSEEKKNINFIKIVIIILMIIIIFFGMYFVSKCISNSENNNMRTIEGEKLVIKCNSAYNKVIEYSFENNILNAVKIFEQFEDKEEYESKKKNYEETGKAVLINANEEQLSLEIEKKDFGSDTGKSYEYIHDKYLIKIIGEYVAI